MSDDRFSHRRAGRVLLDSLFGAGLVPLLRGVVPCLLAIVLWVSVHHFFNWLWPPPPPKPLWTSPEEREARERKLYEDAVRRAMDQAAHKATGRQ